jgi:serine/tyrosine/threonine adenylyltransferase
LIGAEEELGRAVGPGWADSVGKDKIKSWEAKVDELEDKVDDIVQNGCINEYLILMRKVRTQILLLYMFYYHFNRGSVC